MRPIQPLADIETRAPEAGRIRLGVKTGRAMKSLETFRFTSPYKDCIEALAAQYGGHINAWSDPKASPNNQWEVITEAKQIEVFLPPNPVSTWYELYSGAGLLRRCDGEVCSIPQQTGPNQWEPVNAPCICVGKQNMECAPHTRLKVLLPNVPFRGIWRLETKGWNALKELPGMAELIRQLNDSGSMVRVALGIEKRSQMRPSGKRNFVTPTLTMLDSPNQVLAGGAQVQALGSVSLPELGAAPAISASVIEADIVEAEVIDPMEMELFHEIELLADTFNVDKYQLWTGVLLNVKGREGALTSDQVQRIHDAISKMKAGSLRPIGFNIDGTPIWTR